MIYSLDNIKEQVSIFNPVIKQRIIYPKTKWKQYRLVHTLNIKLSDGTIIVIPRGFEWDLSSSPRFMWAVFPPDGDFEIAALIHDFLYRTKLKPKSFADKEMYKWSCKVNDKYIDNELRYLAVRLFGWIVW